MGLTQLNRPTLQYLRDDTFNRFIGAFGAECAQAVPSNNLYVISQVLAGLRDEGWGFRDNLADQIIPDLSSGKYLQRWAAIAGCERRPAKKAKGQIRLTGTPGSTVSIGQGFTFCDGAEYTADASGVINGSGFLLLAVNAVVAGTKGNRAPTDILFTSSTITGVNVQATVPTGITGGAEIETDASLQICIRNRFRKGNTPGSTPAIEGWIQECNQEVTKTCIDDGCGCGIITVRFLMENAYPDTFGTPLPQDLADMQECLDSKKVAGTTIIVRGLAQVPCTFVLSELTPDNEAIRATIRDNLSDVILRRRNCGEAPCEMWGWEALALTPEVKCASIISDCSETKFAQCMIPAPGPVHFI